MDSGYSDTPSPGVSSTSSKMMYSPASSTSDDMPSNNLRYLNLSDSVNPNFQCDAYRLNQVQPDYQCQREKPQLVIIEQPIDKFRFRYKSEMHGTHGSLMGEKTEKSKRTYPTVELRNFYGKALIRCSLYQTDTLKRSPHSHKLVVRNGDDDKCDPHELCVSPEEGFRAVFQGMGIIHTAKKYIVDELILKKLKERKFELGRSLTTREESQIKINAEKEAKDMNLNQVCLAFHAYAINNDDTLSRLCEPVYSRPINNMKSALTGELKIVRLSAVVSSAAGGEDLFLLVEKVGKKNIKVRFYEVDDNDEVVWEDWGLFSEADVHHQYAIALRTPPYKRRDIEEDVFVFIQLERPSDGVRSEPVPFKYKPRDFVISRKRPRTSSSSLSSLELPESIQFNNITSNNFQQTQQKQQQPLSLSEEYDKNGVINKLLNSCTENQSEFGSIPLEYINQVNMDSDELYRLMDTDIIDDNLDSESIDNNLEPDGTVSRKSNTIRKQENSATKLVTPLPSMTTYNRLQSQQKQLKQQSHEINDHWYLTYFQKIKTILRKYAKDDIQKARIEVMNIFKEINRNDNDLLHNAIKDGKSEIVPKLLKMIKELQLQDVLDYKNEMNDTCLHIACLFDRPEYIGALMELGINPNLQNIKGNTPLHIAVINNHTMCATKIIEKSISLGSKQNLEINFSNDDGLTPLHIAIRNGNLQIVRKIIEDGKASVKLQVAKDGNNPLHLAVQQKSEEIVKYLLESTSVDINEHNLSGYTPLKLAYTMGSETKSIAQLLLKRGGRMDNENTLNTTSLVATDSAVNTEDSSSSEDDENVGQLRIDENRKSISNDYNEDEILFDNLCINQLSSIFNTDSKWRLLAEMLNLNSFIFLWMDDNNPTEKMLDYINYHEVRRIKIDEVMEVCEILNEPNAVTCIKEMQRRQKK